MNERGKVSFFAVVLVAAVGGQLFAEDFSRRQTSGQNNAAHENSRESETYWAYRVLRAPAVPRVKNSAWVRIPSDAFILSRIEAKGLSPAPPAGKLTLIRRATYDLIGLPPTPREIETFLADNSPKAYEKLIDRLLASPHYGEKWGRHWLDLVRYAETNGYERDTVKMYAWRYRDYVIDAFNKDKPYDRFIREQLAGDELDEVTAESTIATGYYRLGIWDDEAPDKKQRRYDILDDILNTTSQTFLGTTIGCARCHDHKRDPIPQRDYYRMLAFFQNITPMGKAKAVLRRIHLPDDETQRNGKGNGKGKSQPKKAEHFAMAIDDKGSAPTHVLIRGDPYSEGEKVEPGFPEVLGHPDPIFKKTPDQRTSMRRRMLAEWIASKENQLTARVMVNRIWQHHFGRGIVRSASDFGRLGTGATDPDLLDWLAVAFMKGDWSIKAMHRLIMTSSAYRMSSRGDKKALALDPSNDLLSRFNMRRLTAEEVRDSILSVSGQINLKMGGPSVFPEMPEEVLRTSSMFKKGSFWKTSPAAEQNRRSVYVFVRRSLLLPILTSFDFADTDQSCAVRFTTVQPTQALGLLNSKFTVDQSRHFAARLRQEIGEDPAAQVRRALFLTTQRRPRTDEVQKNVQFMQTMQTQYGMSQEDALKALCLMLINLNEFCYLD